MNGKIQSASSYRLSNSKLSGDVVPNWTGGLSLPLMYVQAPPPPPSTLCSLKEGPFSWPQGPQPGLRSRLSFLTQIMERELPFFSFELDLFTKIQGTLSRSC